MALRKGIVVDTHPEDHSVDLVMADDGSRLVGVQVLAYGASARTGTTNLPNVPKRANKWDITDPTDQEIIAVVDMVGSTPVVVGFLFPQINQVLFDDPERLYSRHRSDVQWTIDGDGNMQLQHPSGTYVRIAESPDLEQLEGKNFDKNAKVDRNTGRQVSVRIGLVGRAVELTFTPDGTVQLEAIGEVVIKGPSILFDADTTRVTGALNVDGHLTFSSGMSGKAGGSGGNAVSIEGSIHATGDIINDGANSNHHTHP